MTIYTFLGGNLGVLSNYLVPDPEHPGAMMTPDVLPGGGDTVVQSASGFDSTGYGSITVNTVSLWLKYGTVTANQGDGVAAGLAGVTDAASITISGAIDNGAQAIAYGTVSAQTINGQVGASEGGLIQAQTINGGSFVTSANSGGIVDVSGNLTGSVAASGSGSMVAVGVDLLGVVNVSDGGSVQAANLSFDGTSASDLFSSVTGSGSQLIVSGNLGLNNATGKAAHLTISAGGTVDVGGNIDLGRLAGNDDSIGLSGAGSALKYVGALTIGDAGKGVLEVRAAATQSLGSAVLGKQGGSSGSVSVLGAGSELTFINDVVVGDAGTGRLGAQDSGILTIEGVLQSASQKGSTASIFIDSSAWLNAPGGMDLGDGSTDLQLRHGSLMSLGGTTLAIGDGSVDTVTITEGAILDAKAVDVTVGGPLAGSKGSVLIDVKSGQLGYAHLGSLDLEAGSEVQVRAKLAVDHDLIVNDPDASSDLSVSGKDGQAAVSGNLLIGSSKNASGSVLISGGGGMAVQGKAGLGTAADSSGYLVVSGKATNGLRSGFFWDSDLAVGLGGFGFMQVQFGADAGSDTGDLFVGAEVDGAEGTGRVFVDSAGTTLRTKTAIIGGATSPSVDQCNEWTYGESATGILGVSTGGRALIAEKVVLLSPTDDLVDLTINTGGGMEIGGTQGVGANQLKIDTAGVLRGHGIVSVGDAVSGDFTPGTLVNDGMIEALEGALTIRADVTNGVTGAMVIRDKATLELEGAVSGNILFDGGTGTALFLNSASQYTQTSSSTLEFKAQILGLAKGNQIDFGPGSWGPFAGDSFAHTEIQGSDLIVTTDHNHQIVYHLGAAPGDAFAFRELDGRVSLTLEDASAQIVVHIDGTPTNGANPYIDSLVRGWAAWNPGAGDITYWFGGSSDVHAAVDVHGETARLSCENPQVNDWNVAEESAFEAALAQYSAATGLSFHKAASVSDANLVWWLLPALGKSGLAGESEGPWMRPDGHLWQYFDDTGWVADPQQLSFGGDGMNTIVHELGHALGLAHPHDGGDEPDASVFPGVTKTGNGGTTGTGGQNQSVYTVMSYNWGWSGQPTSGLDFGQQAGLGALDIAALQFLYGANASYKTGNDAYALPVVNAAGTGWQSIWDTGGIDTITNAGSTSAATIDLRAAPLIGFNAGGFISHAQGIQGGFTIANGVVIENAIGGEGTDILIGNDADNLLDGSEGSDIMKGGLGNDTYIVSQPGDTINEGANQGYDVVKASIGWTLGANIEQLVLVGAVAINAKGNTLANTILGNSEANTIDGSSGNDTVEGRGGADTLLGGAGLDTVSYASSSAGGVTIALNGSLPSAPGDGGDAEGDVVSGFESILGSAFDDTLTGDKLANVIEGGTGADTLEGGLGLDTLSYTGSVAGVAVSLLKGGQAIVSGGDATGDIATGFESITGSAHDDVLTGDGDANVLTGLAGNDTLDGKGGIDTLVGGKDDDVYILDQTGDKVIELAGEGSDTVRIGASYALGANVENLELQGAGAFAGTGNALDNKITGNSAANVLDGGTGADTLIGGAGSDTYVVDNIADTISELFDDGTDTVLASASHGLSDNVEYLTLTGSAAINGKGNALKNTITGNGGANVIEGGGEADILTGGAGSDTLSYAGSAAGVNVTLVAGKEAIVSGGDADDGIGGHDKALGFENVAGSAQADVLTGDAGANVIDGGGGADTLTGGLGNDTYVVDDAGDTTTELDKGGADTVKAWIGWSLDNANGSFIENLTLLGGDDIDATGNVLVNILTGNAGANLLDGRGGADKLIGGAGNDTYVLDNLGDRITEAVGIAGGIDTARIAAGFIGTSYTLAANVENLELLAGANIAVTGNALANRITGNDGANTLSGGAGDDILIGGLGADVLSGGTGKDSFRFLSSDDGGLIGDTIKDYSFALGDRIEILGSAFGGLGAGPLDPSLFETVASGGATGIGNAATRFFYDLAADKLYYDNDGGDRTNAVLLANFSIATTVLSGSDFKVI